MYCVAPVTCAPGRDPKQSIGDSVYPIAENCKWQQAESWSPGCYCVSCHCRGWQVTSTTSALLRSIWMTASLHITSSRCEWESGEGQQASGKGYGCLCMGLFRMALVSPQPSVPWYMNMMKEQEAHQQ